MPQQPESISVTWWPGGRDAPHEVAVDVHPGACMRHLQGSFDLAGDSAGEDR